MKKRTELPNVDHLIELAATDPITAAIECQQALGTLDLAYRDRLYVLLGAIYGVAYAIERDNKQWKEFIKLPFWKIKGKRRPRREKDRNKRLRLAFVFALRATTTALYHRAYTYSRGLEESYNKGVRPERIPDLIKAADGIEKLYDHAVEKAKEAKRRVSNADYLKDLNDGDEPNDDDDLVDTDNAAEKADQSSPRWQAAKPSPSDRQPRALDTDSLKDALDGALRHMRQPRTKFQRQIAGAVEQLEAGLLDWAERRRL